MAPKMSKIQEEIMLEYVLNNIIMVKRDGSVPKDEIKRKWIELSHILNAEPSGVQKTHEKWKKSFGDWKSYVKSKAAKRHELRQKTGTGVTGDEPEALSELEEKLLFLMGKVSAEGSQVVQESSVIVDTENINDDDDDSMHNEQVFSDDDDGFIGVSTPKPTPTSSKAAQLFDRKCSREKFAARRVTITEQLSNKLIASQQEQIEENKRLAEAAENEVKLKEKKLENDIKVLEYKEKKLELKKRCMKKQHQHFITKLRLNKLKYL